jgi:hypothetical protein
MGNLKSTIVIINSVKELEIDKDKFGKLFNLENGICYNN